LKDWDIEMNELMDEIEVDLDLIGGTAVQDKL